MHRCIRQGQQQLILQDRQQVKMFRVDQDIPLVVVVSIKLIFAIDQFKRRRRCQIKCHRLHAALAFELDRAFRTQSQARLATGRLDAFDAYLHRRERFKRILRESWQRCFLDLRFDHPPTLGKLPGINYPRSPRLRIGHTDTPT